MNKRILSLCLALALCLSLMPAGVFAAEPVSNVLGGLACFITMLVVVLPELNEKKQPA